MTCSHIISGWPMRRRMWGFAIVTLTILIAVFSFPRIPQDPKYHLFTDSRSVLGIPNFLDVVSNIPFFIAGVWGLKLLLGRRTVFERPFERWPYFVFFLGIGLTCFGSAYYHWSPTNSTLVWDRLCMAVGFTGIFAGAINDRISGRAGVFALVPLLVLAVFSVFYWRYTELNGHGDLRLYVVVQFYTIVAVLLLIALFPSRYTHSVWLIAGSSAYIIAKLLEVLDRPLFSLFKISGHTLKHLAASAAAFCIIRMLKRRKPTAASSSTGNCPDDVQRLLP